MYGIINETNPPITNGARQRLSDLQDLWKERKQAKQTLIDKEVAAFNAIFDENNIPAVITNIE